VLLQFKAERARGAQPAAFLQALSTRLFPRGAEPGADNYNAAFTFQGLGRLFADPSLLRNLPVEFQVGMEERAGLIGDLGESHPSAWTLPRANWAGNGLPQDSPVALDTVDLVVIIQRRVPVDPQSPETIDGHFTWTNAHPLYAAVENLAQYPSVRVLHVEPLRRYASRKVRDGVYREHFGFIDGLSQPDPFSAPDAPRGTRAALGDFLLGETDSHGDVAAWPKTEGLHQAFDKGSFLVVRKLKQDVPALTEFVTEQAAKLAVSERELRAKMLGRKDDGCPLALGAAQSASNNDFDYDEDREGAGCPLQAHVRRANPRFPDSVSVHNRPMPTPRILRRGFPYGP